MVNPDNTFFDEVYDALFPKVAGYAIAKCRDLSAAQDIVQDTFFELYRLISKKGAAYIKNAEALAIRIAKTKLYRSYMILGKRKEVPLTLTGEDGEYERAELAETDVEEKFINSEAIREVWEIIKGNPPDVQKIFALHYYLGHTLKEVAKILNISEAGVKRRLYGALNEIRNIYNREGNSK